ncbi:MAG TPA: VWA domain-containing protein, partial [Pyrinomonadaceae bacterium]|nr:VWA domain-containing protein [Pyrinomonadaceae bacterium]
MNIITVLFVLIALVLTMPATTDAQETQQDAVRVTSNLVKLNVIVTDKQGRFVNGLKPDQFVVYDQNVRQEIAHFSAGAEPLSIAIIFEVHPESLQQVTAVLTALRQFVSTLKEGDTFFFTAFSPEGSFTTGFVPSAKQVIDHLVSVKAGGPSSLYDVVYAASAELRHAKNLKKSLLIVSDGNDYQSNCSFDEMRNRLQEFDAQIYTITIAGAGAEPIGNRHWMFEDFTRQTGRRPFIWNSEEAFGRAVLAEISRVGGGGSTFSPEMETEPELAAICSQIALELKQQYTLGFYPKKTGTGKWHRLKVRIDAGNSDFSLWY